MSHIKRTSGHIVQDEGTSVSQAAFLNFVGSAVSVSTASGTTTVTVTSGTPEADFSAAFMMMGA